MVLYVDTSFLAKSKKEENEKERRRKIFHKYCQICDKEKCIFFHGVITVALIYN